MTQFKGGYILGKVKRQVVRESNDNEHSEFIFDEINGVDPVELLLDFLDENRDKI